MSDKLKSYEGLCADCEERNNCALRDYRDEDNPCYYGKRRKET